MSHLNGSAADFHRTVDDLIRNSASSKINLACALYITLKECPDAERADLLEHVCNVFDDHGDNAIGQDLTERLKRMNMFISENDLRSITNQHGAVTDKLLEQLVGRNLPEQEFYDRLWNQVVNNPFYESDQERAFALYYCLIDVKIPYFMIPDDGLQLSDNDFANCRKEIRRPENKVRFYLNRKFQLRTQQADMILREIEALDDNRPNQVVLLAYLIGTMQAKYEMLRRQRSS